MTPTDTALVLLSAMLHAVWSASIKGSRDPVLFNWLQLLPAVAAAGAALLWLPEAQALGRTFWAWAAGAALCHAAYMLFLGRALATGDLSFVYPIARATPAVLPFFAVAVLGERLSPMGAAGIATVVVGMAMLHARGRAASGRSRRGGAAALATLAATVGYALTDKAAMALLEARPWHSALPRSLFYFALSSAGAALLLAPVIGLRRRGADVVAFARAEGGGIARAVAFSALGYSLVLEALRTAPASYVVAVRQASVLFALAIGVVWLGERPGRLRSLGALVVAGGVALVGFAG